jgi:hypothetical protein
MATKQEQETPTILRKLSIFVVLFYLIYYLVSKPEADNLTVDHACQGFGWFNCASRQQGRLWPSGAFVLVIVLGRQA